MKQNPMPRRLPYDVVDGVLLGLMLLILVVPGVWLLIFYPGWPDVVPIHYNFAGEANRWGNKSTYLILYAVEWTALILTVVVNHFPRIWNRPSWLNEDNVWATARFLRRFGTGVAIYCGLIVLPLFVAVLQWPRGLSLFVVGFAVCGLLLGGGVYVIVGRRLRRMTSMNDHEEVGE